MDNIDKFDNNIVNNTSILDFVKITDESIKNNQRNNEIKPIKQIEKMLNSSVDDDEDIVEVGIDEAGRGCLAGRVYTASVILPDKYPDDLYLEINDSKKLSPKKRQELRRYIENIAIDYSVEYSDIDEIEEKNILHATIAAMHRSITKLNVAPDNILVDGNYFKQYSDKNGIIIPHQTIKKGDTKYRNIAAASILAKVYHDEHILELLEKNPDYEKYGWRKNMCYATKLHRDAITEYGITEFHRKSFGICRNY